MSNHTVLALSGGLRADSHNTDLLRAAQKFGAGLDIEIYAGLREISPYGQDLDTPDHRPAVVADLRLRIFVWTESDVVVKPEVIAFRSHERFGDAGNLVDETTIDLLQGLLAALTAKIERVQG